LTRPPPSTVREKTEVLYGAENAVRLFSRVVSGAISTIDICDDDIIPHTHTPTSHKIIEKRVLEIEAKFRYITKIKEDNIRYCKELMKVGQVRHLDN